MLLRLLCFVQELKSFRFPIRPPRQLHPVRRDMYLRRGGRGHFWTTYLVLQYMRRFHEVRFLRRRTRTAANGRAGTYLSTSAYVGSIPCYDKPVRSPIYGQVIDHRCRGFRCEAMETSHSSEFSTALMTYVTSLPRISTSGKGDRKRTSLSSLPGYTLPKVPVGPRWDPEPPGYPFPTGK